MPFLSVSEQKITYDEMMTRQILVKSTRHSESKITFLSLLLYPAKYPMTSIYASFYSPNLIPAWSAIILGEAPASPLTHAIRKERFLFLVLLGQYTYSLRRTQVFHSYSYSTHQSTSWCWSSEWEFWSVVTKECFDNFRVILKVWEWPNVGQNSCIVF